MGLVMVVYIARVSWACLHIWSDCEERRERTQGEVTAESYSLRLRLRRPREAAISLSGGAKGTPHGIHSSCRTNVRDSA